MWNSPNKNEQKKATSLDSTPYNGARKVALFLSVLEPDTAERLLTLFDPEIAYAIAEEAKNVAVVSPDDIEDIITDFLNSVDCDSLGSEFTNALVAEALHNAHARSGSVSSDSRRSGRLPFSSLDVMPSERLSKLLENERFATLAVVISKLSGSNQEKMRRILSQDTKKLIQHFNVKSRATPSLQRLEDVLFERAFDD